MMLGRHGVVVVHMLTLLLLYKISAHRITKCLGTGMRSSHGHLISNKRAPKFSVYMQLGANPPMSA